MWHGLSARATGRHRRAIPQPSHSTTHDLRSGRTSAPLDHRSACAVRPPTSHFRLLIALLAFALLALASLAAAQCHEPNTRVVIFIQGLYTTYDSEGTQGTALEPHRFDTLKAAFTARGYADSDLLDFSYGGGAVTDDGAWQPAPYDCATTDRQPAANLAPLEQMLRDYRAEHPEVHFTLVGHSLGGYLAFLAGARDAARPDDEKLQITEVVTLDAPLHGASADKKTILDFIPCEKTYLAGGDLVAARLDANTSDVRAYQAAVMASEGVRLGTFGNLNDCLWATARCIGGGWIDDGFTQFVEGAAVSYSYELTSDIFTSHDAILIAPQPIADVIALVGAP